MADWTLFVSNSATISTVILQLTGIQVCLGFRRKGSTGEISVVTFISGILMSFVWACYGFLISNETVLFVNGTGTILNVAYTMFFFYYCPTPRRRLLKLQIAGSALFLSTLMFLQLALRRKADHSRFMMGLIGAGLSVMFSASPMVSIPHVCRTKSTDSLPFYMILAMFVVNGLWWLYGYLIQDMFIQIPNCIACVLAVFQLTLFAYFRKETTYRKLSAVV